MTGMDKARWRRVSAPLAELLEADAAQRSARLAQLRADNPAFADDVSALLALQAEIETADFLGGSPFGSEPDETRVGKPIGACALERALGGGGMGTVWLARRSDGRCCFRREGRALARLMHPNVAHLIAAGLAAGYAYLVLEYVDGAPIDRWRDGWRLDLAARIRLALQALAAVSHAHGKLIVHRDLKPSNILLTLEGQIKLLDFAVRSKRAGGAFSCRGRGMASTSGLRFRAAIAGFRSPDVRRQVAARPGQCDKRTRPTSRRGRARRALPRLRSGRSPPTRG